MNNPGKTGRPALGAAVLGCGSIGLLHAKALMGVEGARLVAVADVRPERAGAIASRFGVTGCSSLEELLSLPGVDLVSICTPSGTHGWLGAEVARAGRHVVLEKPIDVRLEAADDVIAVSKAAGVVLSVISQHRFDPGVVALKAALDRGDLGRLVLVEARAWWYRTQAYYDSDSWRGTAALDGGALMNQGVHLVDLLLHLLGPVSSVFARAKTVAHEMEREDLALALVEFENGVLGSLCVTTASHPGVPETLAVTGSSASVVLEAGSVLSWEVDERFSRDLDRGCHLQPGPNGVQRRPSAAIGSQKLAVTAHRAQLQDVVDAISGGLPPAVTGEDARMALALVQAAYESAHLGRAVTLANSDAADQG